MHDPNHTFFEMYMFHIVWGASIEYVDCWGGEGFLAKRPVYYSRGWGHNFEEKALKGGKNTQKYVHEVYGCPLMWYLGQIFIHNRVILFWSGVPKLFRQCPRYYADKF